MLRWYNWTYSIRQMCIKSPSPDLTELVNKLFNENRQMYSDKITELVKTYPTLMNIRSGIYDRYVTQIDYTKEQEIFALSCMKL